MPIKLNPPKNTRNSRQKGSKTFKNPREDDQKRAFQGLATASAAASQVREKRLVGRGFYKMLCVLKKMFFVLSFVSKVSRIFRIFWGGLDFFLLRFPRAFLGFEGYINRYI